MIYDIVISDQAEIDLRGIFEYIAFELQAPENASGQLDRLEACIMDLDHPTITDEDHCMYELCQTVFPEQLVLKKNEHILLQNFQGGKYAAYHFKGFPQFLFMVYQEIFCRWLSKTGNQLDEKRPIFDIYRVVGEDGYMEIDICFPLK